MFLGSTELNRWKKFLDDDGFRKLFLQNSISFGIFNNSKNGLWDNFLIQQGTNSGTVKNNSGLAVDSDGNIITRLAVDNITLIDDNNWYWIKISHQFSPIELGIVQIDQYGNLSGVGTEFTKTLRGVPNNPVKITFVNSVSNTQEYWVQEVLNDSLAVLSGVFIAEASLQYQVVGAFTPDIVPPTGNKYPFQYSSCLMTSVLEVVLNTPPALVADKEFLLARVRRNGSALNIQDKRSLNVYRAKSDFDLFSILQSSLNPLIGIENIRFDNSNAPRNENVVHLSWNFRSSNWTTDVNTNRITIIGGQGGKYKSTASFSNGDFDGWYVYAPNGKRSIVRQSSITSLQINLIVDSFDINDYPDPTKQIVVCPPVEVIEIIATPGTTNYMSEKRFEFDINEPYALLKLPVYKDTSCQYTITYRYRNYKLYSQINIIPDDNTVGYLAEASFDANGVQTSNVLQTYTAGLITLQQNINAYSKVINSLITGDLFGLTYIPIVNTSPQYDFQVGSVTQNVIFNGGPLTFTVDQYINLKTTGARSGNIFYLDFRGTFTPSTFKLRVNQDFINVGSPGTNLYTFTYADFANSEISNLVFKFIFDGTNWIYEKTVREIPGNWRDLTSILDTNWSLTASNKIQYRFYGEKIHFYANEINSSLTTPNIHVLDFPVEWGVPSSLTYANGYITLATSNGGGGSSTEAKKPYLLILNMQTKQLLIQRSDVGGGISTNIGFIIDTFLLFTVH